MTILNGGGLSDRPGAVIRLPMLSCFGKRAVSMDNSLALDVLIPLMVLQLTFDLIHQPAIVGASCFA